MSYIKVTVQLQDSLCQPPFEKRTFPCAGLKLVGWLVTAWQYVCVTEPGTVQAAPEDWHSASFGPALLSVGDRETRGRPEAVMTSPSGFRVLAPLQRPPEVLGDVDRHV